MSDLGSPFDTGPDSIEDFSQTPSSMQEEMDDLHYRIDELEVILYDVRDALESMEAADDMPEEDVHKRKLRQILSDTDKVL